MVNIGLAESMNAWAGTAIRKSFDTFAISAIVWG